MWISKTKSKEQFKKSILSDIDKLEDMEDILEIHYLLERMRSRKRKNQYSYIIPHKDKVEVVKYRAQKEKSRG